jgi:hypothetical protein
MKNIQLSESFDVSTLTPAAIRGSTQEQEERTVFKEGTAWVPPDGRGSERLMYDTAKKRFILRVIIDKPHMQSRAYYWLTAAQAIEWTLKRHAGPHTLEAAKILLAQANMQSELAQNFNVALN